MITQMSIDGTSVPSSLLSGLSGKRFQSYVNNLIPLIERVIDSKEFAINFTGRYIDYEDLVEVAKKANTDSKHKIQVKFIPCKNNKSIETDLRDLFQVLQQGPFEEFKTYEVQTAFEKALSSESEVAVLATMSSGKSTLINAMLGVELMPSQNLACTAGITRIRHNSEAKDFKARALNDRGDVLQDWRKAELNILEVWNSSSDVSVIEIEGPIKGIRSLQQNLVLIDTPGPNNFLNKDHREKTIRFIKSDNRPMILYFLTHFLVFCYSNP